jgi:hypothetical protein
MLQAVLRNKAGRVEHQGQSFRWRELFKRNEDLLTATVFGRLPYLSDDAFKAVLNLLIGSEQAVQLSPFVTIDLWPRLTEWEERGYVEPDVILRFERELVMIEVKPPFGGSQSHDQWQAQMKALDVETEYQGYERIYFVALGNTLRTSLAIAADLPRFVPMTQLEWADIRRLLQDESLFSACRQDAAIRQDWLEAFRLFGMLPAVPSWQPLLDFASRLELATAHQQLSLLTPKDVQDDWTPLLNFANGLYLDHRLLATNVQ